MSRMIPLLQTKTADTAHTLIFVSVTRPFSPFLGRASEKMLRKDRFRSDCSL